MDILRSNKSLPVAERFWPSISLLKITGVAVVLTMPLEGFAVFSAVSYPISIPLFISLIFVVLTLFKSLFTGKLSLDRASFWALVTVIPAIFSVSGLLIAATGWESYFRSLANALYLPFLFLCLSQLRFTAKQTKLILLILLVMGALISTLAIYQWLTNLIPQLPSFYIPSTNPLVGPVRPTYNRPTGVFAEPAFLAHYTLFFALCGLLLLTLIHSAAKRRAVLLLIAVNVLGLLVSQSIGGYLIAGVLVLVVMFFPKVTLVHHRIRIMVTMGIMLLLISLLAPLQAHTVIFAGVYSRIKDFAEQTASFMMLPTYSYEITTVRLSLPFSAFLMWIHSPVNSLFGSGIGTFSLAYESLFGIPTPPGIYHATMVWANVLAEQGFLGLILYALFFTAYTSELTVSSTRSRYIQRLTNSVFLLLALFFLLATFTAGLGLERTLGLWVLMGLVNAVRRSLDRQTDFRT